MLFRSSINPAYDYGHGEFANGGVDERAAIYRRCERDGVGISVMKPFSGGQLHGKPSPRSQLHGKIRHSSWP